MSARCSTRRPISTLPGTASGLTARDTNLSSHLAGLAGDLLLDPAPGRSLPPAVLHGARGWLSGYVVPVLSGKLSGTLKVGTESVQFENATGYHDHNWGFWKDVRWQWGQVSGSALSFIYGRVFPPEDVAAADRIPGFLGVLDANGLVGVATNVTIAEHRPEGDAKAAPSSIDVTAKSGEIDVRLTFATDRSVRTALSMTGGANDFLQLGGTYHVAGRAASHRVDFTARGAAETFQPGRRRLSARAHGRHDLGEPEDRGFLAHVCRSGSQ